MRSRRYRNGQSGQAAVEAALTMPLVIFIILGTLQLFLMFQARILAQYAAFRATRAGSVGFGNCERMTHAAVLALLPTFDSFLAPSKPGGSNAEKMALAFAKRKNNRFDPASDAGHDGSIVWVIREHPTAGEAGSPQERDFDDPRGINDVRRLEVRLVYWYPMRIPFANWVMARMFLAHLGLEDYTGANPTMPVSKKPLTAEGPSVNLSTDVRAELLSRVARQQYTWPIETSFTMRMMTPSVRAYFASPRCP